MHEITILVVGGASLIRFPLDRRHHHEPLIAAQRHAPARSYGVLQAAQSLTCLPARIEVEDKAATFRARLQKFAIPQVRRMLTPGALQDVEVVQRVDVRVYLPAQLSGRLIPRARQPAASARSLNWSSSRPQPQ